MSTGLPTIVSDIPANRELVNQQLFRTGDAADLAANISGLWIDLDARTRIRDANQVRIDEHRPEKVISQLQRYYLDLAAKYCGGVSDCLSSSIALSASNQQ
jgi:glycosyltransferase involved in cell wall biosynthesis